MGESTISMAIFNSYVSHYQRVTHLNSSMIKKNDLNGHGFGRMASPSFAELRPQAELQQIRATVEVSGVFPGIQLDPTRDDWMCLWGICGDTPQIW